ncbi:MAG: sensor histidine kinase N-terminal domain-containing protein [Gammaproteobacteria bacterium]|nr:sensor histidine kinase N-terminal domain-containing protein [Gammaproteobacteria bacterium]
MKPSIRRRLLLLLTGTVLAAWLATAAFTYFDARHEIGELLDAHLAQSADLIAAQLEHEFEDEDEGTASRRASTGTSARSPSRYGTGRIGYGCARPTRPRRGCKASPRDTATPSSRASAGAFSVAGTRAATTWCRWASATRSATSWPGAWPAT